MCVTGVTPVIWTSWIEERGAKQLNGFFFLTPSGGRLAAVFWAAPAGRPHFLWVKSATRRQGVTTSPCCARYFIPVRSEGRSNYPATNLAELDALIWARSS